ncbi:MAG: TPM domain-containing protein [Oscillospiraceae bacterium]|nr:TPM domain-containing protein [Oscillospiraceae bacterium]
MKKLISFLLTALLLVGLLAGTASASSEIVAQTDQLYVADYANVLSQSTEQNIVSQAQSLKNLCGGEIAVVTIDFLNDLDSEEYAYELINQWGVGDKDKQNGCVILLVTGEGKGWITVGSGLEDYITAGKLETIENKYLWDDFDAGRYDVAATNTFDQILALYESYYGISVSSGTTAGTASVQNGQYQEQTAYQEEPQQSVFSSLSSIFLVIVMVALLFGGLFRPFRRGWFRPWFGGFWGPPRDDWRHGPRGPGGFGGFGGFGGGGGRGGGFGGGGFGGGGFGGGGGRGGGAGRR